jgi:putative transposase
MSRPPRAAEGGLVYHALNRANARLPIFEDDNDYAAFERTIGEAVTRYDMRLLAYCVMPNHFHLVVWPRQDGDLSQFMRWLTMTLPRGGMPIAIPRGRDTSTRVGLSPFQSRMTAIS